MNIFKLLTYDIKEHNYIYYTSFNPKKDAASFWSYIWEQIRMLMERGNLKYVAKQLWKPFYKKCDPLKSVLFVPISENNKRAMEPIWQKIKPEDFSIAWIGDEKYIPSKLVRFWSMVYIWPLIRLYIKSNYNEKLLIRTYFYEFFNTIGMIVVLNKLLKFHRIRLLVFANDHCSFPRALITVARMQGIKTMYIQHCSVTERFPSLQFDYSFLDGLESYLKYRAAGKTKGKIYLSGNPRFDIMFQYKCTDSRVKKKIGIALNHHDDEKMIKSLCLELLTYGYHEIAIRPHPGEKFNPTWYEEHGIEYSDSNIENPFEFISRMKLIIAGECGIHLDAAMMGTQSIYYNATNSTPLDWYSYIKNDLIPYANSLEDLISFISQNDIEDLEIMYEKMKWYNASYGTKYEGRIGNLMADFIYYALDDKVELFDKLNDFEGMKVSDDTIYTYKN